MNSNKTSALTKIFQERYIIIWQYSCIGPKKGPKRRPSPVRKPAAEPRKDRVGPIRPKLHKLPKKLPQHSHPQQKKKLPKAIKAVKQPVAKKEAPPSPPARRPKQTRVAKPQAQRRDYAAPTYEAPKPQIIIKQVSHQTKLSGDQACFSTCFSPLFAKLKAI